MATSRGRLLGDADERMTLHQASQDRRSSRTSRHEEAKLPRDDLGDEAGRLQAFDRAVGEPAKLEAEFSHDLDAAEVQPVLKLQDGPAVEHGREGVGWAQRRRIA